MRVVNSPKLWDNQYVKPATRLPGPKFGLSVIAGLVIGLVVSLSLTYKPHISFSSLTKSAKDQSHHSVNIAASRSTGPSVLPATTLPDSGQRFDQPLLPEQDNPSVLLLHALATPPPPPVEDCTVMACVALTFDDGPDPASTPLILAALKHEHVKATFFLIGNRVAANANIVRELSLAGEDVGNHSWSHPDFTKLSPALIQQQIDMTQSSIAATGIPAPQLFRPPYGAFRLSLSPYIPMPVILWNVDPKDWQQKDSATIAQLVESQIKPGAIIVMHDHPLTAAALPKIIHDLKGQYKFVTVTKLLNLQPDSRGEFIGRQ